jgi:hypothetical protein
LGVVLVEERRWREAESWGIRGIVESKVESQELLL